MALKPYKVTRTKDGRIFYLRLDERDKADYAKRGFTVEPVADKADTKSAAKTA